MYIFFSIGEKVARIKDYIKVSTVRV